MKVLKILGFIALGLLSVILVVGFMSPSEFEAKATKVINAPVDVVYANCVDLNLRHNWSPWENLDSTMTIEMGEQSVGEGASYSWASATQGNGSLEYTKAIKNELLVSKLNFGTENSPQGTMNFEEAPEGTRVTWTMTTDLGSNPFSRLMYRLLKPSMEAMFAIGLDNLGEVAANADPSDMVEVSTIEWNGGLYLTKLDSSGFDSMDMTMDAGYSALVAEIQDNNLSPNGPAICFYHKWDEENSFAVYEMGFPVSTEFEPSEGFNLITMQPQRVAQTVHYGPYEGMEVAWNGLMKKMEDEGMQESGAPFEEYVVNMYADSNSANWVTNISFPIQ